MARGKIEVGVNVSGTEKLQAITKDLDKVGKEMNKVGGALGAAGLGKFGDIFGAIGSGPVGMIAALTAGIGALTKYLIDAQAAEDALTNKTRDLAIVTGESSSALKLLAQGAAQISEIGDKAAETVAKLSVKFAKLREEARTEPTGAVAQYLSNIGNPKTLTELSSAISQKDRGQQLALIKQLFGEVNAEEEKLLSTTIKLTAWYERLGAYMKRTFANPNWRQANREDRIRGENPEADAEDDRAQASAEKSGYAQYLLAQTRRDIFEEETKAKEASLSSEQKIFALRQKMTSTDTLSAMKTEIQLWQDKLSLTQGVAMKQLISDQLSEKQVAYAQKLRDTELAYLQIKKLQEGVDKETQKDAEAADKAYDAQVTKLEASEDKIRDIKTQALTLSEQLAIKEKEIADHIDTGIDSQVVKNGLIAEQLTLQQKITAAEVARKKSATDKILAAETKMRDNLIGTKTLKEQIAQAELDAQRRFDVNATPEEDAAHAAEAALKVQQLKLKLEDKVKSNMKDGLKNIMQRSQEGAMQGVAGVAMGVKTTGVSDTNTILKLIEKNTRDSAM